MFDKDKFCPVERWARSVQTGRYTSSIMSLTVTPVSSSKQRGRILEKGSDHNPTDVARRSCFPHVTQQNAFLKRKFLVTSWPLGVEFENILTPGNFSKIETFREASEKSSPIKI